MTSTCRPWYPPASLNSFVQISTPRRMLTPKLAVAPVNEMLEPILIGAPPEPWLAASAQETPAAPPAGLASAAGLAASAGLVAAGAAAGAAGFASPAGFAAS